MPQLAGERRKISDFPEEPLTLDFLEFEDGGMRHAGCLTS
jgi:hypothetical protein